MRAACAALIALLGLNATAEDAPDAYVLNDAAELSVIGKDPARSKVFSLPPGTLLFTPDGANRLNSEVLALQTKAQDLETKIKEKSEPSIVAIVIAVGVGIVAGAAMGVVATNAFRDGPK